MSSVMRDVSTACTVFPHNRYEKQYAEGVLLSYLLIVISTAARPEGELIQIQEKRQANGKNFCSKNSQPVLPGLNASGDRAAGGGR
jgi:hypothetical protein